jgi:hypothetical protein
MYCQFKKMFYLVHVRKLECKNFIWDFRPFWIKNYKEPTKRRNIKKYVERKMMRKIKFRTLDFGSTVIYWTTKWRQKYAPTYTWVAIIQKCNISVSCFYKLVNFITEQGEGHFPKILKNVVLNYSSFKVSVKLLSAIDRSKCCSLIELSHFKLNLGSMFYIEKWTHTDLKLFESVLENDWTTLDCP